MEARGTHSGSWALPWDALRPVTVDCPSHWQTNEMLLTGLRPDSAENYWRTFGSNKKSTQVSCLLKGQGECKSSHSFLCGGHGMYLEKECFLSFIFLFWAVLECFFLSPPPPSKSLFILCPLFVLMQQTFDFWINLIMRFPSWTPKKDFDCFKI